MNYSNVRKIKLYFGIFCLTFVVLIFQQCQQGDLKLIPGSSDTKSLVVNAIPIVDCSVPNPPPECNPPPPPANDCQSDNPPPECNLPPICHYPPVVQKCSVIKHTCDHENMSDHISDMDESTEDINKQSYSFNRMDNELVLSSDPNAADLVDCIPVCHIPKGNSDQKKTMYKSVNFLKLFDTNGYKTGGFYLGTCECQKDIPTEDNSEQNCKERKNHDDDDNEEDRDHDL